MGVILLLFHSQRKKFPSMMWRRMDSACVKLPWFSQMLSRLWQIFKNPYLPSYSRLRNRLKIVFLSNYQDLSQRFIDIMSSYSEISGLKVSGSFSSGLSRNLLIVKIHSPVVSSIADSMQDQSRQNNVLCRIIFVMDTRGTGVKRVGAWILLMSIIFSSSSKSRIFVLREWAIPMVYRNF